MSMQNVVFRKIKEMSNRTVQNRPALDTNDLAKELLTSPESLAESLGQLKDLKLISYLTTDNLAVKLTLLGSVVVRTK